MFSDVLHILYKEYNKNNENNCQVITGNISGKDGSVKFFHGPKWKLFEKDESICVRLSICKTPGPMFKKKIIYIKEFWEKQFVNTIMTLNMR